MTCHLVFSSIFQKAFDTIDHAILLSKLEHYGVDGIPLQLVKNYLTNRKQYVKLNEVNSNLLPINTGVPQGSILGPLLFIIYINDFTRASSIFDFICYADDTTLFSTLNNLVNAQNINPDIIINKELAKALQETQTLNHKRYASVART